ncbi:hypothetical protein BJY01DRAFT_221129 [Aspergillus pseudoustus]|uniref:Uncharacterized protein n=1 Tax=Aspergillus pseudoustus TaxID=1810923 RepID=A0ABR4JB72_9EURO
MADQTAVNNALGTILGYLGAEIAPPDLFERLLWPQRFYNGFSFTSIPKMALLMTMGGPLHRAALTVFDNILHNDLLKGRHIGHMLGSPFYADSGLTYTVYDSQGRKEEDEYVRNDLWTRVVAHYPIPSSALATRPTSYTAGGVPVTPTRVRAFHKVSYLKLSAVRDRSQPRVVVTDDETGVATLRVYAALIVTELISVVIGTVVLALWRSLFGLLWFVPLILRLISAAFSLQREPLKLPERLASSSSYSSYSSSSSSSSSSSPSSSRPLTPSVTSETEKPGMISCSSPTPSSTSTCSTLAEPTTPVPTTTTTITNKIFEIHNEKHGFLLIEGPEELILQFFRHYGHPIRNRARESVQLLTIIGLGFVFPVGLVCCLVWMPVSLQYLWLGYQLYTTLAMHIYRFTGGSVWATTEEQLLGQFVEAGRRGEPQVAYLGGATGSGCVRAELDVTFHGRYAEGKAHLERLLLAKRAGESGCY